MIPRSRNPSLVPPRSIASALGSSFNADYSLDSNSGESIAGSDLPCDIQIVHGVLIWYSVLHAALASALRCLESSPAQQQQYFAFHARFSPPPTTTPSRSPTSPSPLTENNDNVQSGGDSGEDEEGGQQQQQRLQPSHDTSRDGEGDGGQKQPVTRGRGRPLKSYSRGFRAGKAGLNKAQKYK